jgi:hypothetical protein
MIHSLKNDAMPKTYAHTLLARLTQAETYPEIQMTIGYGTGVFAATGLTS